jgi:hypothetical protein
MMVRMKRRRHGEKAVYGGGEVPVVVVTGPFSGSACPGGGVGGGDIGFFNAANSRVIFLGFPLLFLESVEQGRLIWEV